MKFPWLLVVLGALLVVPRAETVPDRKAAVLKDRATLENDPRWIYNDYDKGFAEAKRTGKPLLVVLRCIPCLACAGIDAKVLLENTELSPLLDKFQPLSRRPGGAGVSARAWSAPALCRFLVTRELRASDAPSRNDTDSDSDRQNWGCILT